MAVRDYYKILQVDPAADPDVIEAAYRRLARKYHPDSNPAPDATARMAELNEAFAALKDPLRRAMYDATRLRAHTTPLSYTSPVIRRDPEPFRVRIPRYQPPEEVEPAPRAEPGGRLLHKILAVLIVLAILGVIAAIGWAMSGY